MELNVFSFGKAKVVTKSLYLNGTTHFLLHGYNFGFEFFFPLNVKTKKEEEKIVVQTHLLLKKYNT